MTVRRRLMTMLSTYCASFIPALSSEGFPFQPGIALLRSFGYSFGGIADRPVHVDKNYPHNSQCTCFWELRCYYYSADGLVLYRIEIVTEQVA